MNETKAATVNPCFTSLPKEFMDLISKERRRRRQLQADTAKVSPDAPPIEQLDWIAPLVICTQCFTELPRECFSANQLNRGKNRCFSCVGVVPPASVEALPQLAEEWVTCSQCFGMLPKTYFSGSQLSSGQNCCMVCMGVAIAASNSLPFTGWPGGDPFTQSSDAKSYEEGGSGFGKENQTEGASTSDNIEQPTCSLPHEASEVLVVNSATSGAYTALRQDAREATLVALDAEWRPDTDRRSNNPIAVLQLAFPLSCRVYVVQLGRLQYKLPSEVRSMLQNPYVPKVGFALDAKDILKFHRSHITVAPYSLVDIQACCAASLGLPDKSLLGLQRAAEELLGYYEMRKDKRISCSNWENVELTPQQVRYAAMDAWVTLRLFFYCSPETANVPWQ